MLKPPTQTPMPDRRRLDPDGAMGAAIAAGVALLISLGFATSFTTLMNLAVAQAGYPRWLAPAVPLSLDLGIVVLSLKVIRAAREGRGAVILRVIVAVLSLATVAVNGTAAATLTAGLLHAAPPAMFVICFESVVISQRRNALAAAGRLPDPLPRMGWAHWVLDTPRTWAAWRMEVLQQSPELISGSHVALGRPSLSDAASVAVTDRGAAVLEAHWSLVHGAPVPELAPAEDARTVAAALVRETPQVSAPELAAALAQRGHTVSVRTAQRWKAALVATCE